MEWEEISFAKSLDDPLQICPPESFFHPRLEGVESFPKSLLSDYALPSHNDIDSATSDIFHQGNANDLPDIPAAFEDVFLQDDSLSSVLSGEEIFSQIEICSNFLDECQNSSENGNVGELINPGDNFDCNVLPLSEPCHGADAGVGAGNGALSPSCASDSAMDCAINFNIDDYTRSDTIEVKTELCEESADLNSQYEKVVTDIAKIKQEVDWVSDDDDSLLSDFFSEDDPSEISKEYADFFKHLLTTPVDDFDLTLNVFNNVDPDGNDTSEGSGDGSANSADGSQPDKHCIDHILADHCYNLPWDENSGMLTPPNSSDDSEPESDISSQSIKSEFPSRKHHVVNPNYSSKYLNKTVKLKHKKDLKFVFSLKVKDKINSGGIKTPPGRSLLKKNQPQGLNPAKDILRDVLSKRASYKKRQKLNETAMAVQSLLHSEDKSIQSDKILKMQNEREQHNQMERLRRIELKNEFDKLKSLIPEIARSEKVSKLNVLNYSAEYVKKLERLDQRLKLRKIEMIEKQQKLTEQLKRLQ
eukprot:TRINITY_DN64450_c0_g1_i1.p1 TRINITY_DN64450_c0_g1~~TRINITY_DN64450_c0_g1_i1.p1  ORF type:complete len:530 (-),score=99.32 TRINITY_DN64450_c0_g1_i1:100-1689(-)